MEDKIYHFIAIGGVGQSALAKILAIKGFKVSGSDVNESKYTKMLQELNVDVKIGHDKNNIKENQIIVLSSAIKENNPELIRAKELNLPLYHRSDILKMISEMYPCFIGFSGTHGKTTTSGLCSYILENINAKPAYASGGIISGLDTNSNSYKESKIFVAELDESDGTIIKYLPDYIVINNLEADHFDFYKNGEDDLISQFKTFINNLKVSSKVFINIDDNGNKKLLPFIKNKITYSIKDNTADYFAGEIQTDSYNLYKKNKFLSKIEMGISGIHNVYNTMAVLSVLIEMGFDLDEMLPFVKSFSGMKRRFEKLYDKEITIYDDYAHHPTEIKAVLKAAREKTNANITVVFQPHRYTRLKALFDDFLNSFDLADKLYVVDAYSAGDNYDCEYNSENFAKKIKHKNVQYIAGSMDEAAKKIANLLNKGDFVITVGAGDVTKIGHSLGAYYEAR